MEWSQMYEQQSFESLLWVKKKKLANFFFFSKTVSRFMIIALKYSIFIPIKLTL